MQIFATHRWQKEQAEKVQAGQQVTEGKNKDVKKTEKERTAFSCYSSTEEASESES